MPTIAWGTSAGADITVPFSGNCLLNGARIVGTAPDDSVALAFNELEPDANTLGLWHLNEPEWTGAEGEVKDASSYSSHGTAYGGAQTCDGWLERSGHFDGYDDFVTVSQVPQLNGLAYTLTAEMWFYLEDYGGVHREAVCRRGQFSLLWLHHNVDTWAARCIVKQSDGFIAFRYLPPPWELANAWHHLAMVVDTSSRYFECYLDGQPVSWGYDRYLPHEGVPIANTDNDLRIGGYIEPPGEVWTRPFAGYLDEVRISNIVRYDGQFWPHRFEQGTVTVRYPLTQAMKLTAVDWSGTFGSGYGYVTQVEVYSGGSWQVVASDPAGLTPPIRWLDYTVSGPDILRLTLVPKQDTLQSETPLLDWVLVNIEALGQAVPRYPLRFSAEHSIISATSTSKTITIETSRKGLGVG